MHNGGRCWSLGVRSLGQRVPRCLEYCAAAPIRSGWWAVISEPLPFRIPLLVQGHMPHDNWRCAGRPGPALALRGQHLSPQAWRWTQVGGMCFLWPPQPGMGTRGHGWRMHSEVTWGLPQGPRQLTVAPDTKDVLRHGDGLGGHPWSPVLGVQCTGCRLTSAGSGVGSKPRHVSLHLSRAGCPPGSEMCRAVPQALGTSFWDPVNPSAHWVVGPDGTQPALQTPSGTLGRTLLTEDHPRQ